MNGELRIGFFNKKFIAAGEEITFDYHFQRYGYVFDRTFLLIVLYIQSKYLHTHTHTIFVYFVHISLCQFLFLNGFSFAYLNIRKEAQKCYCEAPNCRGWIGETPEEEKEKIEKKEKHEKDIKKKKEEKKPADYMEDEDVSIVQWIILLVLYIIY